jgi:hypothetical protein
VVDITPQSPMVTRAALALSLHAGEDLSPVRTVLVVLAALRDPSDDLIRIIQDEAGPFDENAKAIWHEAIDHLLGNGQ